MKQSSRIRVGLVGAGEWARVGHVPAIQSRPEFELIAVATTRESTARAAADRYQIPYAYDRFERLVNHPDVDLVVVNNRAPEHFEVARAAIAAKKHVYCEWPLTTNTAQSAILLEEAEKAGVCHAVGLQRRMGASARSLRQLVRDGFVGRVRSVRLVVTEPTFFTTRPAVLRFTVPTENFSNILSIYGGHFLDMLMTIVGEPAEFSAVAVNQFDSVTIRETGESVPTAAPDEVVLSGTLATGGVLSVHIEAGKQNDFGVELVITGTEGDLRLTYAEAFSGTHDGIVHGTQGSRQPMARLPVPESLNWNPASELRGSVRELADLYAAFAGDLQTATRTAPNFHDALRMHRLIDAIQNASRSGDRVQVTQLAEWPL